LGGLVAGGGFGDGGAATSRAPASASKSAWETNGRRGAALPEDLSPGSLPEFFQ